MNRIFPLALCLTLPACAAPPLAYLTQAADPSAKASPSSVADATAGTRNYAPVEPGDWEKTNRAVTPHGEQK
jgi:hypothetical protein